MSIPRARILLVICALIWFLPHKAAADEGLSTIAGRWLSQTLESDWPDHPEWLAMLADILQGSQLGPTDGWFSKATAQTRYGWDAVRSRLDRDGDGQVARDEFPGPDADFARLDRDGDATLTAADFDWGAHALTPTPGAMLYYMADRDGNGKVTREEFNTLFDAADTDHRGFLSQDDLRALLNPPRRRSGGGSRRTDRARPRWSRGYSSRRSVPSGPAPPWETPRGFHLAYRQGTARSPRTRSVASR